MLPHQKTKLCIAFPMLIGNSPCAVPGYSASVAWERSDYEQAAQRERTSCHRTEDHAMSKLHQRHFSRMLKI